jgi:RNA polymerase sigma-70 factor (sigma-E family)
VGRTRLVRRGAAGDPLFDDFVRAHAPILLRTAVLITGDRGHAEDLVQTTLLRTAGRWSTAAASPKAYAFRVLINLGRDRARRLRRRISEELSGSVETPFLSPAAVDETATVLDRQLLTSALAELTAAQREVVVLRFLADLSVAETATVLGISEGTVKSTTAKATARLRLLLTDDPFPPEVHSDY